MIAVDTNVVVRLVANDHPVQTARAAAVFRSGPVYIAKTVLLEAAWVLAHAYGRDDASILRILSGVAGLPNVEIEDSRVVADAFAAMERGLDFADALHLASRPSPARFLTFDRRLVARSRRIPNARVELA